MTKHAAPKKKPMTTQQKKERTARTKTAVGKAGAEAGKALMATPERAPVPASTMGKTSAGYKGAGKGLAKTKGLAKRRRSGLATRRRQGTK